MLLSQNEVQFYQNNSYLIKKGLFKNEIDSISKMVDEVASWGDDYSKWLRFYEMDDPTKLSRVENFAPYHDELNKILTGQRMISLVTELMGEKAVLYKERINYKYPNGGAHSAHQDGVAYEKGMEMKFDADSSPYISFLISIDPATESNGCLEVVPNWPLEKLEILPMEQPYPEHPNFSKISQSIEDELEWKKLKTEPGDVIFFTERLPHRSQRNNSDKSRRILYGVYNPLSEGDKREGYYEKKRANINDKRYLVGNPHAPVKTGQK
ncbi:phytanoyl-CoA dioxygenase family protein [Gracilimonas sp.]|uniref:phytanoyl-CoA dioxygenase family protein n=1 Tax=Gracilimonas sp. TaxID=1974203 RepID=UPI003D12E0CE